MKRLGIVGSHFHDRKRSACGALHHGANRYCPVVNFSPVKQVHIKDRWYQKVKRTEVESAKPSLSSSARPSVSPA